jgi:hypothetical protein
MHSVHDRHRPEVIVVLVTDPARRNAMCGGHRSRTRHRELPTRRGWAWPWLLSVHSGGAALWRLSVRSQARGPRHGESSAGDVITRATVVYDQPLFLRTLSNFARALPASYDVKTVLTDFAGSVTGVLGLSGSGVSLAEDGRLRFVTAVSATSSDLERVQERYQRGPCRRAFDTGRTVSVRDVREAPDEWPEFADAARQLGIAGVAGVPMRLADNIIGAMDLYAAEPRDWSEEDLSVAGVLADVVTSYIVNASTLRQQQQLNEQLQSALDSRIVIEQAKGITAQHDGITLDEAYQRMRRHARDHNGSVRMVADAIVRVGLRL